MRALLVTGSTLALACAAGACKTAQHEREASSGDYAGEEKIRFRSEGESSGGSNVAGYVLAPFENVVYLPWKIIGSGVKGASDGVGSAFSRDRMPVLGILFSPVNAVAGFVTGAAEGIGIQPVLVGPQDDFSRAMAQPTRHATTIWWYE